MFREEQSPEFMAEIGLRNIHKPRANFSEEEICLIVSLQKELGNRWVAIADRLNEICKTNWSGAQVQQRFIQLEIEKKNGGRKRNRVDWDAEADNQILVFRNQWMEKSDHSKSIHSRTRGMWPAMAIAMPGKNVKNLQERYYRLLSKSSAMTSTEVTSTEVTSLAETSMAMTLDNQPNLFGVSATTKLTLTMVAASAISAATTSLFETLLTETSLDVTAAAKVATATKVAPLSYELSEYERQRQERIERNHERLVMLGLVSEPKEVKKKVVKKRKSLPVNTPRRELSVRNRKVISYKEDEKEDENEDVY